MVQSDLHSTTDVFSRSIIDTRRVWRTCASENFLSDCWTAEACWSRNLLRSGMSISADNVQLQLAAAYACQGLWMTVIIEVVTQLHIRETRTLQHRKGSDGTRTQALQAAKLCLPRCPSGIKGSTIRLLAVMEAMKRVSQNRTESVRPLFAELYEYNTSNEPWYSMELILPGITLQQVFDVASAASHPIPEEIVFHVADQAARAFHFLHVDCRLICTDISQSNMMLRYPGREVPVMPDLVLIEWLDLQSLMGSRQSTLSSFSDSIQTTVKHMRRETMRNAEKAEAFGHFLLASADISEAETQEES
ncbi:hypothetical protein IG631_23628 [Alternaria alternata]|nr:hypothetical protein IG631_23628 [Alternaria alternata]